MKKPGTKHRNDDLYIEVTALMEEEREISVCSLARMLLRLILLKNAKMYLTHI